jgi:hypothetical protein
VIEFIKNEDYKYVRVLGSFYLRLTGRPAEVYQYLEPLYNDYRKVRRRLTSGAYSICHMDELIEELLHEVRVKLGRRALAWEQQPRRRWVRVPTGAGVPTSAGFLTGAGFLTSAG